VRWERLRPAELQSSDWIAVQRGKVYAALDRLDGEANKFGPLDLGLVGVGCALGYLPLRIAEIKDRERWPRLFAWFDEVSKRPSFARTVPVLS
jgi:glutathione S-transferase